MEIYQFLRGCSKHIMQTNQVDKSRNQVTVKIAGLLARCQSKNCMQLSDDKLVVVINHIFGSILFSK
jgi:hypothetical protein